VIARRGFLSRFVAGVAALAAAPATALAALRSHDLPARGVQVLLPGGRASSAIREAAAVLRAKMEQHGVTDTDWRGGNGMYERMLYEPTTVYDHRSCTTTVIPPRRQRPIPHAAARACAEGDYIPRPEAPLS
jgi:hypothetical protein